MAGQPTGHRLDRQKLAAARQRAGLTSEQLAERLGVNPGLVRQWMSGHKGISAPNLRDLADKLDVRPAELQHPVEQPSLADLRWQVALTQAELAERLDVDRSYIVAWEAGRLGFSSRTKRGYIQAHFGLTGDDVAATPAGELPLPIAGRLATALSTTAEAVQRAFGLSSREQP